MTGAFDFVDGSRAYTCRVEEADGGPPEAWWFGVAGDDNSRYAPFRADAGDTEASVCARVVLNYR